MSSSTEAGHAAPESPAAPRPRLSKLAVAAFVTGVLPLIPVGIGLGISGLVATRRGRRRGHALAVSALVCATAWLIIAAALGTVGYLTHGFHRPVTVRYRQSAVFSLREGDCIDIPSAQAYTIQPCSSPHDAEVFATFGLPASAWPGTAAVQQAARQDCSARLSGYLNPQLSISFTQAYVYPDETAWKAGTRTVICEVRAASGQLTQSVRGAS